jgi:hypothetical protein
VVNSYRGSTSKRGGVPQSTGAENGRFPTPAWTQCCAGEAVVVVTTNVEPSTAQSRDASNEPEWDLPLKRRRRPSAWAGQSGGGDVRFIVEHVSEAEVERK